MQTRTGLKENPYNTEVPPKTYLIPSILATIFCCLPMGIGGIYYASKVEELFRIKEYEKAHEASETARKYMISAVFTGLLAFILLTIAIAIKVTMG